MQAMYPLHQRYWVDHLQINCKQLHDTFNMDTLFSKVKSCNKNTCAHLTLLEPSLKLIQLCPNQA